MPTKIEAELSPQQVEALCAQLYREGAGGQLLRRIQAEAARLGVTISLMSASAFRDGRLKEEFAALRAKSERAQQVAAFAKEGLSMSEAASVRLAETVFDELERPGFAAALTAEEKDTYSKIIARARTSDQRAAYLAPKIRELEQRIELQQFDAAAAVLDHAEEIKLVVADRSLDSGAKTERVRTILFGARPADWSPTATKGGES